MGTIEIPAVVANKARAFGAEAWLADLPALVDSLAHRWGLTVGRPYAEGTEAWVAPVERADGTAAVLKVCVPRPGEAAAREAAVLRLAGGRGCARLLAADGPAEALLIERLGPSLHSLGYPMEDRHRILVDTVAQLWRPAAAIEEADRRLLVSGAAKARWLIDHIRRLWDRLEEPCSRAAVDHAVAFARSRAEAHDDERAVLTHGDVHEWNALRVDCHHDGENSHGESGDGGESGAGGAWKLVDPDGMLAEPEYDLGIIMREDPVELLDDIEAGDPRRRARQLAAWSGCDERAIWEWGVVERVSTGLLCVEIDLQPVGSQMLAAADRLAAARS